MVISTALLVRERGARATSIDDVHAHSGAPRGSVYHHFPGGRAELLREATDYAGEFTAARIARAESTLEVLDGLHRTYRNQLTRSGYRAGCPVVAVSVEAGDPETDQSAHKQLLDRAAAAFTSWTDALASRLEADGVTAGRAQELAVLVIASVEGALVMARARRDTRPLDDVHRRLRELLLTETETTTRRPAS
jgi:AcrR family transcriptional regulator